MSSDQQQPQQSPELPDSEIDRIQACLDASRWDEDIGADMLEGNTLQRLIDSHRWLKSERDRLQSLRDGLINGDEPIGFYLD